MTLAEAYEKANDKDKLQCEIGDEKMSGIKEIIDGENLFEVGLRFAVSDQWQIIPAEEIVVSAEEIKKLVMDRWIDHDLTVGVTVDETIIISHGNGRLERDLEYRDMKNLLEEWNASETVSYQLAALKKFTERVESVLLALPLLTKESK